MSKILWLDFETYSETDIAKCGSFKYIDDPNFEVLLLAYGIDEEPIKLVDFMNEETWPEDFLKALNDTDVLKVAHNCAFERSVIKRELSYSPPEQWFDTMHLVAQCGLPMSLGAAGEALGLKEEEAKIKDGKALIRYFCIPCKPTKANGQRERNFPEHAPDKWTRFCEYCVRDVETMRTIYHKLENWLPNNREHEFWCLDARINENGVRIDRQLVRNAVAMDLKNKEELTERAVALTGLENPKSVSQVKQWLYDQEGLSFPSLNKKVIADVVGKLQSDTAKEFMSIRNELSKTSVKKYEAMIRSMSRSDDHVRGCFLFYGVSRTGRFAGRLVQFQNLSKNHDPTLDSMRNLVKDGHYSTLKFIYDGVADPLSQLVRTAMIPEDGHKFMISDFSAIEARVIAWLAGEQWRLDTFRNGGDIYCASASQMFHVPVEKHGQNAELRGKGKIAELALGYGGGINSLKAFGADKMGMTEEEMQETVDLWRESSPKIVAMWKTIEKAAIRAITRKGIVNVPEHMLCFSYEKGILWMSLPSGRRIAYWGATYDEDKFNRERKVISYMGVDQQTKKWSRVQTWGGKLTENAVQAVARDCLREAMINLYENGYDIRAHVHDECIVTEPISSGRTVQMMSDVMGLPIPWAPGLPLRADGYEGKYYFKD